MSTSSGPHIIRESLAFGYDTGYGLTNRGIATRFCKGEPTTNIWYDSYGQDINTRSDFQAPMQSTAGLNQSVRPETWNGNRIWQLDRTAGSAGTYDSWRRCVDTSVSNNYGSTRYVSIKICLPFGGSISELALHTGGGNGSHNSSHFTKIPLSDVPSDAPFKDSWYHFLASANWSSTTTGHCVGLAFKSGNATTFLATEPIYYNSEANIPFTSTSRGHSDTLFNLVSRDSISTTNASYDDNGMLTFDGTDDYIQVSLTGANLDSGCTIEGILKRKSTPPAWRTFFNLKPSSANTPFFEFRSTGATSNIVTDYYNGTSDYTTTAFSMTNNQFYHCVGTHDGNGNIALYINGELHNSGGSVPAMSLGTSPRLTIGRAYSNDRYTDIDAPVVKVYSKALNAQEVLQNYKSYKKRFNL